MAKTEVLHVNLESDLATVSVEDLERPLGLGGKALGLTLLERHLDRTLQRCDGPPSPLSIITSSQVSRFSFPGSNRAGGYGFSPLTGRFLESYVGGTLGRDLASLGWDAVVIHGRSARPVVLEIDESGGRLAPAGDAAGMDVFLADDALADRYGKSASRLVVGPAGEHGIPFASAHVNKHHAFGRGGFGALLGLTGLKAVVVLPPRQRSESLPPADVRTAFQAARLRVTSLAKDSPTAQAYRRLGTPMMVALLNEAGGFPAAYWSRGSVTHRRSLEAETYRDWADVRTEACPPCPMRCRKALTVREGPMAGRTLHGPEYESVYAFGGLCLIEDPRQVAVLHEQCNRLGMDTITAGNLVALSMEAHRRGDRDDAPAYGDHIAVGRLLDDISTGATELGRLLGHGIVEASNALGLEDEAVHVKGMEPAGYDPRALPGMGLAYATSPRGACHLRSTFYKPILAGMTDGLEPREVARLFVDYEDRLFLHDCLIMCRFYRDFLDWGTLAAMVGATAGRAVDVAELQEIAGGLLTRVRRLNFGLGMTADEDRLPSRFFRESLEDAAPLDETAIGTLLRTYYELRGWNRLGLT